MAALFGVAVRQGDQIAEVAHKQIVILTQSTGDDFISVAVAAPDDQGGVNAVAAQIRELVAEIEQDLGTIDILVNNAGIIKRIPMTEMSVGDFQQVTDIDLVGPFFCAKAVLPGMIHKGHGKIINVCSMMSELGRETVFAYASAKGSLKILIRRI